MFSETGGNKYFVHHRYSLEKDSVCLWYIVEKDLIEKKTKVSFELFTTFPFEVDNFFFLCDDFLER